MKWGLYDTQGECWFGDDTGPKLFDDEILARLAAQVIDGQLGSDLFCRTQARRYDNTGTALRDQIPIKRTALESIQRLEGSNE